MDEASFITSQGRSIGPGGPIMSHAWYSNHSLAPWPDCIGLSRYIAITNLSIIAVFVEYLRQFLIDLNQIYRHSSVHKTRLREFFQLLGSSGFRARRRRDFFRHVVPVTV